MSTAAELFEGGAYSRLGGFHDGDILLFRIDSQEKTLQLRLSDFVEENGEAQLVQYEFQNVSEISIEQPTYEAGFHHLAFPQDSQIDSLTAIGLGGSNLKFILKGLYGWSMTWISSAFTE